MIAGGLHAEIGPKYFRVGHMHVSSTNATLGHIDKMWQVIGETANSDTCESSYT